MPIKMLLLNENDLRQVSVLFVILFYRLLMLSYMILIMFLYEKIRSSILNTREILLRSLIICMEKVLFCLSVWLTMLLQRFRVLMVVR